MALINCNFFSETLGVASSVNVILPEKAAGLIGMDSKQEGKRPPVLYLLHGLSDDQTIWLRRTSIERYASNYGLAVVMPYGGHSFYRNNAPWDRYWDYISRELPEKMNLFFHISTDREDTFAAGLSMGGYGALKLVLNCPERFAAAAMLSGAFEMKQMRDGDPAFHKYIFGTPEETAGSCDDLPFQMKRLAKSGQPKPELYQACGTEDFLFDVNCRYRDMLRDLGYNLTWNQRPGNHNWAFWDEEIQRVLAWLPFRNKK